MNVTQQLKQANSRLKSANVGVTIEVRGTRLCLRATLPPKPNSIMISPHQQRIGLGIRANPAGVVTAEIEARKVGALVDCNEFSWQPYLKTSIILPTEAPTITIAEWIALLERDYFQRRAKTPESQSTWKKDYWAILQRLPPDQVLSRDVLLATLLQTAPDTKTRQRACKALSTLAKFAGIELDTKPLAGNYNPQRVNPRNLPEEQLIADWYKRIDNPAWRWAYGMIATFGLRPHEIFYIDSSRLELGDYLISVTNGKTKARQVWAFYPEWIEQFHLCDRQVPEVTGRNNSELGERCSQYFHRNAELPFKPYDLRHCWAIRTLEFGLDITLAAQQMGHSAQVHSNLYHHWISAKHHKRAFEALIQRSDRPKPPEIV